MHRIAWILLCMASVLVYGCGSSEPPMSLRTQTSALTAPPKFVSTPPASASEGSPYQYKVEAVDPEGKSVTYSLVRGPRGLYLDVTTGQVSWLPPFGSAGYAAVEIEAKDGDGDVAYQSFTINVAKGKYQEPAVYWGISATDKVRKLDGSGKLIGDYSITGTGASSLSVDQKTGEVWVTARTSGHVSKLSADGKLLFATSGLNQPIGVAVDANGDAWIAEFGSNTLAKLDKNQGQITRYNLNYNNGPHIVRISSTGDIWVGTSAGTAGRVILLNSGGFFQKDWALVRPVQDMAVDPIDKTLVVSMWHASSTNQFARIDKAETTPVYTTTPNQYGGAIGVDTARFVWLHIYNTGRLYRFTPSGKEASNVAIGTSYYGRMDVNQEFHLNVNGTIRVYNSAGDVTQRIYTFPADNANNRGDIQWGPGSIANQPPVFASSPITTAKEGQAYFYTAEAKDPEGLPVSYSLVRSPPGVWIDRTTGKVHWIPAFGRSGTHTVEIRATDGGGQSASQTYNVQVTTNAYKTWDVIWGVVDRANGRIAKKDYAGKTIATYSTGGQNTTSVAVNPTTGEVWATNHDSGSVTKMSKDGLILATRQGFNKPLGIVIDDKGNAWVTENGHAVVTMINANATQEDRFNISGLTGPNTIIRASNGDLWVGTGSGTSGYVVRMNSSGQVLRYWQVVRPVQDLAEDVLSGEILVSLWHSSSSNQIARINKDSTTVNYFISPGQYGGALGVDSAGFVWLTIYNTNRLYRYAPNGDALDNYAINWGYQGVIDGNNEFVLNARGNILIVNPEGQRVRNYDFGTANESNRSHQMTGPGTTSNAPPIFSSQPVTKATEGKAYFYQSKATDPEGHAISYSLVRNPPGMWISPDSGKIHWIPAFGRNGNHIVEIEASDTNGATTRQTYTLEVAVGKREDPTVIWGVVASDSIRKSDIKGNVIGEYPTGGTGARSVAVDPRNGNVWVTNYDSGSVSKLDADGKIAFTKTGFKNPWGIGIDASGVAWVAQYGDTSMVMISEDGSAVNYRSVSGITNLRVVSIDSSGDIWIGAYHSANGTIIRCDQNGTVLRTWTTPRPVMAIAPDPSTGDILFTMWHSSSSNQYGRILKSNQQIEYVILPNQYGGSIAVDAAGFIYVSVYNTTRTYRFSPEGHNLNNWSGWGYYSTIDRNNELYLIHNNGEVRVYNSETVYTLRNYAFAAANANNNAALFFGPGVIKNDPPVFTSSPVTTGVEGKPYFYQAKAVDPEGHVVTFALRRAPVGMWVDPEMGLVRWLPPFGRQGTHTVELEARDSTSKITVQTYSLVISAGNRVPARVYWGVIASNKIRKSDAVSSATIGEYETGGTDARSLAVDQRNGDVWVVNYSGSVSKLNPDGIIRFTKTGLKSPRGVAIASSGDAWVTEHGADSIVQIKADGSAVNRFNLSGISGPASVIISSKGEIWVGTWTGANGHVIRLNASGNMLKSWQVPMPVSSIAEDLVTGDLLFAMWYNNATAAQIGRLALTASAPTYFAVPARYMAGLSVDAAGFIWVGDNTNGRTYRYSPTGVLLRTITAYHHSSYIDINSEYIGQRSNNGSLYVYHPDGDYADKFYTYASTQINMGWPAWGGPGTNKNEVPVFSSKPVTSGVEGQAYFYSVVAIDPEGHEITYTLKRAPRGMWIDSKSGRLHWLSPFGSTGLHAVTVEASDNTGKIAEQSFSLNIAKGILQVPTVVWGISATDKVRKYDWNGVQIGEYATGGTGARSVAVDQNSGTAYVTHHDSDTVTKLSPNGLILFTKTGIMGAWGIDLDKQGNAWVSSYKGTTLFRITADGSKVDQLNINSRKDAHKVLIDSTGHIWLAHIQSNYIIKLDSTGKFLREWLVAHSPRDLAEDLSTGDMLFSAWRQNNTAVMGRINGSTGAVEYITVAGSGGGSGLGADAAGFAWLGIHYLSNTYQIAPNGSTTGIFSAPVTTYGHVDINGQFWANQNGTVQIYDSSGRLTGKRFAFGTANQNNNAERYYGPGAITNQPPVFTSSPSNTAYEGNAYFYQAACIDPEGHEVSFSLRTAPQGMWIDPASGLLRWMVSFGVAGKHTVDVVCSDSTGQSANQTYTLQVFASKRSEYVVWGVMPTGRVRKLDFAGQQLGEYLSGGNDPRGIAVNRTTGEVWITNYSSHTVVKLDSKGQLLFTKTGLTNPWGIALDKDGNAWVASYGIASLANIDAAGNTVGHVSINNRSGPRTVIVTRNGDIWVGTNSGYVIKLDSKGQFQKEWAAGISVYDLAEDPTTGDIVFSMWASNARKYGRISAAKEELTWVDLPNAYSGGISVDQAGFVWVSVYNNSRTYRYSPSGLDTGLSFSGWGYFANVDPNGEIIYNVGGNFNRYNAAMILDRTYSFNSVNQNNNGIAFGIGTTANTKPTIISTPPTVATTGRLYSTQIVATDPDGDPLTYTLPTAPTGMTISATTGLIVWTPSNAQAGKHNVSVMVSDGRGGTDTQNFTITVSSGNRSPVITSTPPLKITAGSSYTYEVKATDPDGDPLTYKLVQSPSAMSIDAKSGLIYWVPGMVDVGSHTVEVVVEDGHGGRANQVWSITVTQGNRKPTIISTPITGATVGKLYSYKVEATDPDGDPITYRLRRSPTGMSIDAKSGEISWTPTVGQVGTQTVEVEASDGQGGTDLQAYNIKVIRTNSPPQFTSTPITSAMVGRAYSYQLTASDPDGDTLSFSLVRGPSGMTVDKQSGVVSWTPQLRQVGDNAVEVRVDDGQGGSDTQNFTIKVTSVNNPPEVKSTPITSVLAGTEYKYAIWAVDPDGDNISFKLTTGPQGMAVDLSNGVVTWKTSLSDVGKHQVIVEISDGKGGKTDHAFELNVTRDNSPPKITSAPVTQTKEGELYVYEVKASDPDGDALTFSLLRSPTGMIIGATSGKIEWKPGKSDVGTHLVEVKVDDGNGGVDLQVYALIVENVNAPPKITSTPPQDAYEGELLIYHVKAVDPDPNDRVSFALLKGPTGAKIDAATGLLQWIPARGDAGKQLAFEIEAKDLEGKTDTQSFQIRVLRRCKMDTDCASTEICEQNQGICLDAGCFARGASCKTGEICGIDGKCTKDPCQGVTCGADQFCRFGSCITSCASVSCSSGQICIDGQCENDLCASVTCAIGEFCKSSTGQCEKNGCLSGACQPRRVCIEGRCILDPCLGVRCPDEKTEYCVNGQCIKTPSCVVDRDCPNPEQICEGGFCIPGGCRAHSFGYCTGGFVCLADGNCGAPPCRGVKCAANEFCRDGTCVKPCVGINCPAGRKCTDGQCVSDACAGITCKAGEICIDGKCERDHCQASGLCKGTRVCIDNRCVAEPCADVICPDPTRMECRRGQCIAPTCQSDADCKTPGDLCVQGLCIAPQCSKSQPCASSDEICQNGVCIKNNCKDIKCASDEFCINGTCRRSCGAVICEPDERCVYGHCEKDPCAKVTCAANEYCDPRTASCKRNPCHAGGCEPGRVCIEGLCVDDPCANISCPQGLTCELGQCTGRPSCTGFDDQCPGANICIAGICSPPGCLADAKLCAPSEICDADGKCKANPCASVSCASDEYCDASGQCRRVCPTCPPDQACGAGGSCLPDPCHDLHCSQGQICVGGVCVEDNCATHQCKHGRICTSGQGCSADPCANITCPQPSVCRLGRCSGDMHSQEIPPAEVPPSEQAQQEAITHPEGVSEVIAETTTEPVSESIGDASDYDKTSTDTDIAVEVVISDQVSGADQVNLSDIEPPAGGCGCSAAGGQTGLVMLLLLIGLAMFSLLRRKRTHHLKENPSMRLIVSLLLLLSTTLAWSSSANAQHVIWVPDWNGGNIARFTENGTLVGRYPTGGTNPFGVAVNQSNGEVWVTNYGSGSVTKLTKRGAISFTLTGLNNPAGIALDNAGHAWVAEHGTSSLIQISSSGQITNRIDTGIAGPYMVTMGKNGDVWAVTRSGSSSATGAILRLLAPSFTRVDWWRLSCGGYGIATASDGTIYGTHYANCRPNSLAKMDPSVGSGHGANAPLVSNNKNYIDLTAVAGDTTGGVWVASLNNSRVFRMDQSGIVSSDVSVAAVYGLQFYDNKVWVITSTRVMILNNTGGSLANFAHNGTSYGRGIFVGPGDTVNDPPVFSSTAPATATEGRPYFYQAKAADPEGHTVTYKLNSGPTGMWIHPETGKVHWMPAFGMAGVQTATIEANDGTGKVATQVFNISVAQGTRRGFDVIWGIGANNTVTRQNYQGTVLGNYPSGGTGPIALAVDGQSGEVWISNNTSDSVTKLDANGHVKLTIENIAKPLGIILDNNRDVWVAENDSSFVVRIKNDGSRIDRFGIKTRPNPRTIMRDTRGNIWVGTYSGSTGFVIMLDSNGQFVNEWDATRPVMDLTEDPSTGDILFSTWHSSGSNFYGRIDPTQSTYERITTPNQYGGSIAADAAGFVYLSIHNTSNTHRFAPNGQELNRWSTSTAYYGYIDSNNELLLNRSGNINVYDSRGVSMNRVYTFGTTNQNNNGYPHFGPGITTNAPPVFKSTPLTTAREGTPYFHTVKAEDPEGHPVTYSLKLAPSGMWINPETGQIHWLPAFGNTGTFTVEVVANDNTGQTASQSFNISVQSNTRSDYSVYWGIVSSTQVRKLDRNGKTIGTYLSGGTTPYALAVDQKTGDVWISNYGSDNVTKLDQSGHVKLTISNISKPWGITLDASGNAWVAESGDLSVLRIAANGSRVDRFAVCTIESPRTVIIDHAKNIWVVSNASATGLITMLDANGQLVNRWQIDRPALDLAADPLTGHVYFGLWHSSSSNRFGRINPKSSDVEYFTAPSTYVGAMGVDAAGFVWISVHNNGITYRFSPTATQVQSLSTSTAYYGYFDVNNEYFLNRSGNITVYTPQMASTGRVYSFGTSNQTNNGYPHFGPGTSANFPPEITSNPVTKATEGTAYFYQVVAKDPEGHKLTYSLPTAPTGMWIDSATGKIHWLPAFGTVGTHSVTVAVTDDGNLATQQSFNIQVDKGTRKGFQVMWGIIADNRVQRTDESGNFVAHHDTGGTNPRSVAVDPKTGHAWVTNYDSNNVVKLSPTGRMEHNIENLTQPWGVAIDAKGNAWVTEYGDAVVRISADGKQITRFSINGRANPRSIIITPKGDVWVSTHSAYVVQLDQHGNFVQEWAARSSVWSVAWDALNEELIFSGWHASLSNWFGRITPGNKDITYYTTPGQYGGGLAVDSAGFIYLSVHGTGRTYRFSPNGDNLTNWSTSTAYFATMSSDGELILNRTGHVYPYDSTGKHTGRVYTYHTNNQYNNGQVSYGPGQIVNQPPAFTSTPVRTATEGKPYFYQVAGKDPEGHLLEFSLKNAPAGMWISPTSGKIHWLPSFGIAGSHNVDVQISDSTGRTANQQFDIVVSQGTRIGFNVIWGIIDSDKLQKLDGSGNHIATYSTGGTTARSLAVDSRSGDVWITYSGSKEVVKMSTDGQVRFRIPGFADPWGIALDSGGSAWVADYGTNQVVQISYNGQHVRQFNVNDRPSPRVIIVDPSDNVWVGTYPSGNVGYVIRLDPSGNFVQEWATAGPVMDLSFDPYQEHCLYSPWRNATAAAHYGRIEPKTGKHTTIALPSYYVGAIATDPAGFVYVSVHQTSRTYRYSPEGDALNNWSTSTAYFAQLSPDNELLLNRSGAIHVYRPTGDHTNRSYTFAAVNQNNNGTPIFGPGTLMNKPPVFGSTPVTVATEGRPYFYVAFATDPEGQTVTYSLASKIPGMWINPQTGRVHWIPAFGSAGSHLVDIVASDSSGKTANQSFIITVSVGTRAEYLVWGVASISEVAAYNSVNGQQVGKYITNAGQPRSVAVDRISGNVWVTHYDSNTVVQLSSGGQILHSFSNLQKPWGVAIDGDGNAWVAENGSNSVARILRNGSAIDRFSAYNQPGPKGVAIDAYGNVWVGTHSGNNGTIVLLDAKGNFVSQWQSVRGVQDMAIDPTTQHLVFTIWDASLGNRIGRVDPAAKEIEYILLPSMYGGGIAIDQAGFIFVYVHNNKRFHRLSPLGQALESVATGVGYHASIDPNNELLVNVSGPVTIYNSTLQSAVRTFSFPAQNTNNNGAPFGPGSSTNRPPVITSTALTKAVTGDTYRYQVLATDPDGDPLTYILAKHPSGMQISVGTGLITWTPSPNQSGSHAVELTVSDGRGGVAKQSYTITVTQGNQPPKITSSPVTQVLFGQVYTYKVEATDPDGDPITFHLRRGPVGMQLHPTSGVLSWTPSNQDQGNHPVEVEARDNSGAFDTQFFVVTVRSANSPPKITSQPVTTATENRPYTYTVTATDPDGDNISFSLSASPTGMKIDAATGLILWTPAWGSKGDHIITIVASDGTVKDTQTFTLKVSAGNRPPTITSTPPTIAKEGQEYRYPVVASDPDGHSLTFKLTNHPTGMQIHPSSGLVTWTPTVKDQGVHLITITVEDSEGESTNQSYMLTVSGANNPPKFTSTPVTIAEQHQPYIYQATAIDPDRDTLSFKLLKAPAGMKIDPATGSVTWTPSQSDVGKHAVSIEVSDGLGGTDTQDFEITVKDVNDPPKITSTPPEEAEEEVNYVYDVKASDPDNDPLTFKLLLNPSGMTINPSSGQIMWLPPKGSAGTKHVVRVEVTDGRNGSDTQAWEIRVKAKISPNRKPQVLSTPLNIAYEGIKYVYAIIAIDPDGDPIVYKLKGGSPASASISPSGLIEWTPTKGDAGKDFTFEVELSDGKGGIEDHIFKVSVRTRCLVDSDCPPDHICSSASGQCVSGGCWLPGKGCPTGQICDPQGKCIADPCAKITCAANEFCRDGACIKACTGVKCAANEYCEDGVCKINRCSNTSCWPGQICEKETGLCIPDTCQQGTCGDGRICVDGRCIPDPCARITCPDPKTQVCINGQCIEPHTCKLDRDCPLATDICRAGKCVPGGCLAFGPGYCKAPFVCLADGRCGEPSCSGITCPQGEFCKDGKCLKVCADIVCGEGQICREGICIKDPCASITCNAGDICIDGKCEADLCLASGLCKPGQICIDNKCVPDPCAGVTCPNPNTQQCVRGDCIESSCRKDDDCGTGEFICVDGRCRKLECSLSNPCSANKRCREGYCILDPCANVSCPKHQFCVGGSCRMSCAGIFCNPDQHCVFGQCEQNPCANISCHTEEYCDPKSGTCQPNPCHSGGCVQGRICLNGVCVDDPCIHITCPNGQSCQAGQCKGELSCKGDSNCPGIAVCIQNKCIDPGCIAKPALCQQAEVCDDQGKCTADPCAKTKCSEREYCDASGTCTPICDACPGKERCAANGSCEPDPCADISCSADQICIEGVCEINDCKDIRCKHGRICKPGVGCIHDPCLSLLCPSGSSCQAGRCTVSATPSEIPHTEIPHTEIPHTEIPTPDASEPTDTIQPELHTELTPETPTEITPTTDVVGSPDIVLPEAIEPPAGCGCQHSSHIPIVPLFIFLIIALLALSRRKNLPTT